MHIAFVFTGAQLTDNEIRLVRAACVLDGVSIVTVVSIAESPTLKSRVERMRANIERTVARRSLAMRPLSSVSDIARVVTVKAPSEIAATLNGVERLVNLSGTAVPQLGDSVAALVELRWDGGRVHGLGQTRAMGRPASLVEVTCTRGDAAVAIVERSVLTLTPANPGSDRQNASSRSLALLLRALRQTDAELRVHAVSRANENSASPSSNFVEHTFSAVAVIASAIARRVTRKFWRDDIWELRYRTNPADFVQNTGTLNTRGFKSYHVEYNRFVADPMPFSHAGTHAIFFENFPYATLKGVISCVVVQENGELSASKDVLEKPYHLSYPFVFRDGEHIYMIPETSANRTVDLYECTSFPYQWEFRKTLLHDISANDATLYHDGTRWWMFATVSEEGAYAWDELHLFSADSILADWTPHSQNPVKCDVSSARPAGPLFMNNGRLIRPTQDCSRTYGGAINLCEIETLSLAEFRERVIDHLDPRVFPGMVGLHTLAASEGLEVVDVMPRRRVRWE